MKETDKKLKTLNNEIKKMLEEIESNLYETKNTNWSHVGSMEHVKSQLKDVLVFLGV